MDMYRGFTGSVVFLVGKYIRLNLRDLRVGFTQGYAGGQRNLGFRAEGLRFTSTLQCASSPKSNTSQEVPGRALDPGIQGIHRKVLGLRRSTIRTRY